MSGFEIAAAALSLAAAGTGTGLQISAQKSANEKRQSEINRIREASSESSKKQLALSRKNVEEQYEPKNRMQRINKAARTITASLNEELAQKRGETTDVEVSGEVSDAFTRGKAAQVARSLEQAHKQARLVGRVGATDKVLQNESLANANTAIEKDTEGSNLRALLRLYETNLGAIQPDDTALITGEALKTAGVLGSFYRPNRSAAVAAPLGARGGF